MDVCFMLSLAPFSFPVFFFFFGLLGDGFERRRLELEVFVFEGEMGGGMAGSSKSEASSLLVDAFWFDSDVPVKMVFSTCSAFQ